MSWTKLKTRTVHLTMKHKIRTRIELPPSFRSMNRVLYCLPNICLTTLQKSFWQDWLSQFRIFTKNSLAVFQQWCFSLFMNVLKKRFYVWTHCIAGVGWKRLAGDGSIKLSLAHKNTFWKGSFFSWKWPTYII